jgi:GTPase SAR1 family protein
MNEDGKQLSEVYQEFNDVISLVHVLTKDIQQEDYKKIVEEMQFHLSSPYMFVIVGEVKAGKSSFINALLESEQDVCAVAASPMTDTIQQIIYGDKQKEESINQYLKRIYFPEEILKEISIVDTPGTNTIVEHHQEITERFIPHADLIVFVFEAKNPYRQSAWAFFDYINDDWRKNIVFILQQKDLMEDEDLKTNLEGVRNQAIKKGITEPIVFAVSAKMERENKPDSGFEDLRNYIADNILDGKSAIRKLLNNLTTTGSLTTKIDHSIDLRNKQFQSDLKFRNDIKETLDRQEDKTNRQVDILTENLLSSYDTITTDKIKSLSDGLSFFSVLKRSFSNLLGGDKKLKDWLQDQSRDFELQLNTTLKDKLQSGITDVAEDIQMMGKLVSSKITNSKDILKDSDEIFSDIAERRSYVLSDLQTSFKDFMKNAENFYDGALMDESSKMTPNLAAGSGMAIVGVILSTAINGAVFDITGGILTTAGVLFASVSLGWKRKKVLNQFKDEISNARVRIEKEVREKLKDYASKIKGRIDQNFYKLDDHLKQEKEAVSNLVSLSETIKNKITDLQTKLMAELN